jgi:NitT/TauT family transport system substrate-binding protein
MIIRSRKISSRTLREPRFARRAALAPIVAVAAFAAAATLVPLGAAGDAPAPVHIVVGYQPYYTGAWSALVVKERELWKKYLPAGSTVDWEVGLQGSVITNNMLAGKYQMGYVGDMPAVVATTKRAQGDIRIISVTSFNNQQCDLFVVRPDAPQFKTPLEAIKWMDGKRVAVPKGTCTDRFAQEVFKRTNVKPAEYLNENIEVITTNLRAGNLDAAAIWEPNVAHVGEIVGNKSARLVSTGADWDQHDTGLVIVNKDFLDKNHDAVVGMLKADIDAQRFILSDYPKNACTIADWATSNTTGYDKKVMWYALYGRPPVGDPKAHAVRFKAELAFDDPVRAFLKSASDFLLSTNVISEPMPADAIVDDPLKQAMRELKVKAPLGEAATYPASAYPCG